MIYVAVITYSVLDLDNKKHLRHLVEAFPDKTQAIAFVDAAADGGLEDGRTYRHGSVHTVEADE